jgi:hypothetical protein
VEHKDGVPAVHVYEPGEPTGVYAPVDIFRGELRRDVPFEITLELGKITP